MAKGLGGDQPMKLDWKRRGRRHSFAAALAVVLAAGMAATAALADSPDVKIPPQTPSTTVVSVTHPTPTTTTVTVKGGWVWTTHNSDCNTNRAGVGFAIDWNDPNDPGFHVTTLNGVSVDVGSTLAVNGNTVDNVVHPTPGDAAIDGGGGEETDVATPSQFALWRGGCGTDTYNFNGKLEPQGIWGPRAHVLNAAGTLDSGSQPGISHTYLNSAIANGINICALTYDVHPGKTPTQNGGVGIPGKASEITAGGTGHNGDNSAESNKQTPVGNACVPIFVPTAKTTPSVVPNDKATVGGNNPTGTVTFELFPPTTSGATCTGTPSFSQTVTLSGGSATTSNTTFKASTPGTWRWLLIYNGDSHNSSKTSACGVETFVIATT